MVGMDILHPGIMGNFGCSAYFREEIFLLQFFFRIVKDSADFVVVDNKRVVYYSLCYEVRYIQNIAVVTSVVYHAPVLVAGRGEDVASGNNELYQVVLKRGGLFKGEVDHVVFIE